MGDIENKRQFKNFSKNTDAKSQHIAIEIE
jgi:hypothetical protein